MSGASSTSSGKALLTLAAAPVPDRVRDILQSLHRLVSSSLAPQLVQTTSELERELFRQAERAISTQIQSDLYAEMRALRENSDAFVVHFQDSLAQLLAGLTETTEPQPDTADNTAFQNLTLVQDNDIDRDIILHEMARREAARCSTPLILLAQRFGVLAGRKAFDIERLPLGPHRLAGALRDSGEVLQLSLDTQISLYRAFGHHVMEGYSELLERINVHLAHEGVLPGLIYQPYFVKGSPRRRSQEGAATEDTRGRAAGKSPLTSWMGQAPRTDWGASMREAGVLPDLAGLGMSPASPDPGGMADGAPALPAHAGAGTPGAASPVMSALQQMLGAARLAAAQQGHAGAGAASADGRTVGSGGTAGAGGAGAGAGAGAGSFDHRAAMDAGLALPDPAAGENAQQAAQPVPSTAVMEVLGKLQAQAAVQALSGQRRTINDIQKALLSEVRAKYGPQAALLPQDADTLDLLSMLYSQIQREVRNATPAATMLSQLQVPVVRAAISDPAFFIRDQHPARELLNAVAESGATWLNDDDMDPVLLQRLGKAVKRVVDEYQGDEAVFAAANEEVQGYFRAAARKAEVSERRQIEAARGKERLETAKQLAERTINQICAETPPPKFVQSLLQNAWSDVLTLTLLRQGETSNEWRQLREATRQIAEITASEAAPELDTELGGKLEESLKRVGYHDEEAGAIARRLATPGGEDDTLSRTELVAKLKNKSRLGVDENKEAAAETGKEIPPPRNEAENLHYQQLRTLPFGTWFEFVINQQGDTRRQRLSWYSLITDNALFVNVRGQKVAEHTLDALSRLMAQNQARVVTEDRGRLIDRAWQATLRTLRALSGAPEQDPAHDH